MSREQGLNQKRVQRHLNRVISAAYGFRGFPGIIVGVDGTGTGKKEGQAGGSRKNKDPYDDYEPFHHYAETLDTVPVERRKTPVKMMAISERVTISG